MIRKILIYPDPILARVADPVEVVNEEILEIARDMIDTMKFYNGIGLAANQIGILKQIIVVDLEHLGVDKKELVLINPVILSFEGESVDEEGCLSFPGLYLTIKRPMRVTVEAQVLGDKLEKRLIHAEGRFSRVLLHEIDHLNGILFIDRVSREVKARVLYDWLKKLKKTDLQYEKSRNIRREI